MPINSPHPTIAFVYDRINTTYGGAESLIDQIIRTFPNAPVFTAVFDSRKNWVSHNRVIVSFLQRLGLSHKHQVLLPLMPIGFESLDLGKYDVIVSFTSAEAKGVLTKPNQLHICYIFSPPKYLYEFQTYYQHYSCSLKGKFIKPLLLLIFRYLRWWDQQAIFRPDLLLTLSKKSAHGINLIYKRESQVIYPAINNFWLEKHSLDPKLSITLKKIAKKYLICTCRLVEYKRVDLAIQVAINRGQPLLIVGEGADKTRLVALTKTLVAQQQPADNYSWYERKLGNDLSDSISCALSRHACVIFLGNVTQKELLTLFSLARAGLALGDEDFGLTALEILACHTPVVISQGSGVAELIAHQTGVAIMTQPDPTIVDQLLEQLPQRAQLTPKVINQVKSEKFIHRFTSLIIREWQKHQRL